jgi:hypothetical protein
MDDYVKQTDGYFKLHCRDVYNYGCLFMCLLRISGHSGSPDDVVDTYNYAREQGLIGKNCFVNNWDALLQLLSSPWRHGARYQVPSLAAALNDHEPDVAVARWATEQGFWHFTVIGRNGVTYDPYGPGAAYRLDLLSCNRIDLLRAV